MTAIGINGESCSRIHLDKSYRDQAVLAILGINSSNTGRASGTHHRPLRHTDPAPG